MGQHDRSIEAAATSAAAARLLTRTPLISTSGKLTVSKLVIESGLSRHAVYRHRCIVEQFRETAARNTAPQDVLRDTIDQCSALEREHAATAPGTPRRAGDWTAVARHGHQHKHRALPTAPEPRHHRRPGQTDPPAPAVRTQTVRDS